MEATKLLDWFTVINLPTIAHNHMVFILQALFSQHFSTMTDRSFIRL